MCLADHFDLDEFPNDLARWCWDMLGDHMLAEQLGLIDPYQYESIESLRADLINVIEERVWGIDRVPSCPPGLELHWSVRGSSLTTRANDFRRLPRWPRRFLSSRSGRSSITCTLPGCGHRAVRTISPIGSSPTVPMRDSSRDCGKSTRNS